MISVRRLKKIITNIEIDSSERSYSTTIWPAKEYIIDRKVLTSIIHELLLRRNGRWPESRFNPNGPQPSDPDYTGF